MDEKEIKEIDIEKEIPENVNLELSNNRGEEE